MATDTKREGRHYSMRLKRLGGIGLSALRMRFVDEYMKDRKPGAAARRAGYGTGAVKAGTQNLRIPAVRAEIERREAERATRLDIKDDDILRDLKAIAHFDLRSLFDRATGKVIVNPWDMNEEQLRAMVNFDIVVLNKDGDYIVKLNPGNRMKALELLGKYKKLFTDKVEHSGTVVTYSTDFGDGADADAEE